MKKTKFAVLLTALIAILGLSSCLGEPDPIQPNAEYVKVSGGFMGYNFIDIRNKVINPTNKELLPADLDASYAFITYNYDTRLYNLTADRDVEITGLVPIKTNYLTPSLENMDKLSNAPVYSLEGQFRYVFWDVNNMFVPVFYFIKQDKDEAEQKKEINSHRFDMYYDRNNISESNSLILHFRHNVADESLNDKRNILTYNMYHYDLSSAVYEYEASKGKKPSEIVIKYIQNITNSDYPEGDNITESELRINYSDIMNAFSKQ